MPNSVLFPVDFMPKRKPPAAKGPQKSSTATSKPSLPIEIDPDLIAQLRLLSKPDRRRLGHAIERRLIGEGADEHGRGGRAPRDRAKASNSPVRHNPKNGDES